MSEFDMQSQPHPEGEGFSEPLDISEPVAAVAEALTGVPGAGLIAPGGGPESLVVVDLGSGVREAVRKACAVHGRGEPVWFEVGSTAFPQQDGSIAPVFIITVSIASLMIGQKVNSVTLMPNLHAPEEQIDQTVASMLEQLRQGRFEMAQPAAGGPPKG